MKKRYQIDTQRAVQPFRQMAAQTDNSIQLVIPLKEVVDLIQRARRAVRRRSHPPSR